MASQAAPIFPKSEVNVEEPSLIVPAEATAEEPLYLSNFDQQVLFNLESVYFFPPSHKTTDNVVEVLRGALSKVLVPYHFMAGRLRKNDAERRVEVDCNRAGALFAGASTDLTFADLQDTPTFISLLRDFILHEPTSHKLSDVPLLTVQVTRFKCGGFVVGISRNHALVGGASGDEFLKNYTAIARGAGLQVTPVLSRSPLKARSPPQPKFEHFEYTKVDKVPKDSYFTTSNSLENLELQGNFGPHMFHWKTFHFPTDLLNSLKSKALLDGTISKCTTFEALATHVWQARTKALNKDPDWLSNLLFVVDCRKVLNPPLPTGFTGNTLSLACARMQARDLAQKPFSACLKEVQEAKARLTDEYVKSAIDWMEVNHGIPSVNGGIYLSSWIRFSFLDVDFGWGPPSHTMFIPSERSKDGVVFIPSKQGAGLDVCLALEPHQAATFQRHTGSILKWPPPQAAAHRIGAAGQVLAPSRSYSTCTGSSSSGSISASTNQIAKRKAYSAYSDTVLGALRRNWIFFKKCSKI